MIRQLPDGIRQVKISNSPIHLAVDMVGNIQVQQQLHGLVFLGGCQRRADGFEGGGFEFGGIGEGVVDGFLLVREPGFPVELHRETSRPEEGCQGCDYRTESIAPGRPGKVGFQ